jgi:hypothetical protein
MSTITTTGSDQKLYLEDEFGADKTLAITSVGGKLYFKKARTTTELATTTVRSAEETITTSGLTGSIYTVADSSKFRVNDDKYPVLNTSSVRIGTVKISAIPSATTVQVEKIGNDFTLTSGDKIVIRRDSYYREDSTNIIETSVSPYVSIKSETSAVDVVVDILGDEVKKKS